MEQYYILTGKFTKKARHEPSAELDSKFYYQCVHDNRVLHLPFLPKQHKLKYAMQ